MRSRRLELALRRDTGRRLLPKRLDDLSRSLDKPGESIVLLDLERTDRIWDALRHAQQLSRDKPNAAFQRTWPASERGQVKRVLNKIEEHAPDRPLYLLRALSDYCGAVETTSSEILGHAFRLIGLDSCWGTTPTGRARVASRCTICSYGAKNG